jgi:hypothetical protein
LLLVDTATSARQLADFVRGRLRLAAHPRFAPHLDDGDGATPQATVLASDANLVVWPHDALYAPTLHRRRAHTVVVIAGDEGVRAAAARWAEQHVDARDPEPRSRDRAARTEARTPPALGGPVEVVHAACPGRLDADSLLRLLARAGLPKILLRGDPAWVRAGASRLADAGLIVAARSDGTQLGLW